MKNSRIHHKRICFLIINILYRFVVHNLSKWNKHEMAHDLQDSKWDKHLSHLLDIFMYKDFMPWNFSFLFGIGSCLTWNCQPIISLSLCMHLAHDPHFQLSYSALHYTQFFFNIDYISVPMFVIQDIDNQDIYVHIIQVPEALREHIIYFSLWFF